MTESADIFSRLLGEVNAHLRFLTNIGCHSVECAPKTHKIIESWKHSPRISSETLENVRADLTECRRCRLSGQRGNLVFGAGKAGARLMFIGKSPGPEEDRTGEPFIGPAGQLLDKIIQAIQLSRAEVYICDVIKCRPPDDRNPLAAEIDTCLPFLKRQIQAVRPDFICVLGSVAARALLQTNKPISLLRGKFSEYEGIPVMPTYHPAFLLKNPDKKREVWEDMKKLMKAMDGS